MSRYKPGTASCPLSVVEITVSCRGLRNRDLLTLSDPMVVLFGKNPLESDWFEIGRTETIHDNLDPDFSRLLRINLFFEERQEIRFEVYDVDKPTNALSAQEFLGFYESNLAEIVSNRKVEKLLTQTNKTLKGKIILQAQEVCECKQSLALQVEAEDLTAKNYVFCCFCGSSDPILTIWKINEDSSETMLYRSEVVKGDLSLRWKKCRIAIVRLCNGNYDASVEIKVMHHNPGGKEELIGVALTTLRHLTDELCRAGEAFYPQFYLELTNPRQRALDPGYTNSGIIRFPVCRVEIEYSLLDFIQAGTDINCTVGIDFTASNGDPRNPASRHYRNTEQPPLPSEYGALILSVISILQEYDKEQIFHLYGFGAVIPGQNDVSHCFHVSGHPSSPCVKGLEQLMEVYETCVNAVQFSGPTCFAPLIRQFSAHASQVLDGSKYYILLILTDGLVIDMQQTIDAIILATVLPVSIIIVGLGEEDFTGMKVLDAEEEPLYSPRIQKRALREIVQFVEFLEFQKKIKGSEIMTAGVQLARKVLEGVPAQVLSYMKQNGIKPGSWKQSIRAPTS